MKKNLLFISIVLSFGALFVLPTSAEPTDKQIKAAKSVAVKRAKELTKDGWEMASSTPMVIALQQHYLKLEAFGGTAREYSPIIEGKRNIDIAKNEARNVASRYYAQDANSFIESKVKSMTEISDRESVKNFIAIFKQEMVSEMKSTLEPSFTIFRPNPTDKTKKDVQIFYTYKFDTEKYDADFNNGIKGINQ